MIYAWPDRQHLSEFWGAEADALVVIEWGVDETSEWIEDTNPVRLLHGRTIQPSESEAPADTTNLPGGADRSSRALPRAPLAMTRGSSGMKKTSSGPT